MPRIVYLDYNASTPIDPRVLPGVVGALDSFGNPSSSHHCLGRAATEVVEEARGRVSSLVNRPGQDVIFTSGATEAASIGLVGAMLGAPDRPNVVVSATEHKAILAAAEFGARLSGGEARLAGVDRRGQLDLEQLEELVDDSVAVVAVMAANNETGVVGPVVQAADLARRFGSMVFVDTTQAVGKADLADAVGAADIAVCSSHKIYGPKGAGALIASRRVQKRLVSLQAGGGQERGFRGGTHNTPAIAGFGLAAQFVMSDWVEDVTRIRQLSSHLMELLNAGLSDLQVNGEGAERLSNTLNLRFAGADADAVMASMPDVCVSTGSACQSASPSPSHVLQAMGLTRCEAEESLRISLGRPTTVEEVEIAAGRIIDAVSRVRELNAA